MKKQIISILLAICFCVAMLTGCSSDKAPAETVSTNNRPASYDENQTPNGSSLDDESVSPVENVENEETSISDNSTPSEAPTVDIEWTEFSYVQVDQDGYNYKVTYKLSPWILTSNSEIVNSVWNEVGDGKELPADMSSWGLEKQTGNTWRGENYYMLVGGGDWFIHEMTDMYYCIGTVSIENITEGWSITSDNSRSTVTSVAWCSAYDDLYSSLFALSKTFYSNKISTTGNYIWTSPTLTKDTWGPVPVIIMAPENYSPNFPDGEHIEDMLNGFFYVKYGSQVGVLGNQVISDDSSTRGYEVYIGVIGKDGEYYPPNQSAAGE